MTKVRFIFRAINASTYAVEKKETLLLSKTAAYKHQKAIEKEFPRCNVTCVTHIDDMEPSMRAQLREDARSYFM